MKVRDIIIYLLSVLAILLCMSLLMPEKGIDIGSHNYTLPKIGEILTFEKKEVEKDALQRMQQIEEDLNKTEIEEQLKLKERLAEEGKKLARDKEFLATLSENPAQIYLPNNNAHYFDKLFEAMDSCTSRGEVVHILHYGDSQIEADRITCYIRKKLQDKFGGEGPGLLPVVQPIHSYTVKQTHSDNMKRYLVDGTKQIKADNQRYGALAQFATFDGKAKFGIRSKLETHNSFNNIRLFVGNTSDNFVVSMTQGANKKQKDSKTIEAKTTGASLINWRLKNEVKEINIELEGSGELYAISLDGQSGVAVDNVPMRGSRGTFFTRMEQSLFAYMHKQLNTKMILLEFGGNVMPAITSMDDIDAYQKLMAMQINWIKKACPDVPIILIGPSDMGITINGKVQTRPFLPENVEAMKKTANDNGIAFWNMYEVMGGYNSMIDWVAQQPRLAISDYTHMTNRGAEKIGKIFTESLLKYYDYYTSCKKTTEDKPADEDTAGKDSTRQEK